MLLVAMGRGPAMEVQDCFPFCVCECQLCCCILQARAIITDDFIGANDLNGGNPVDDIDGGQATTQVRPHD